MAGYGIPEFDIARVLGISVMTLMKYYREQLDTAAIRANAAVAQSLWRMATRGNNVAAAIFWAKTRMRWTEPPREFIATAEQPSKKEQALEAARTAGDGTLWSELLHDSDRPN